MNERVELTVKATEVGTVVLESIGLELFVLTPEKAEALADALRQMAQVARKGSADANTGL